MKKYFLLGLFALLFAGCEQIDLGYGKLCVSNSTNELYLLVYIVDWRGDVYTSGVVKNYNYYTLPVGRYKVEAYGTYYDKDYEDIKRVSVFKNSTSEVTFY